MIPSTKQAIQERLGKGLIDQAEVLAHTHGLFDFLVSQFDSQKGYKSGLRLLKRNKKDIYQYPYLVKRSQNNYVFFLSQKFTWVAEFAFRFEICCVEYLFCMLFFIYTFVF